MIKLGQFPYSINWQWVIIIIPIEKVELSLDDRFSLCGLGIVELEAKTCSKMMVIQSRSPVHDSKVDWFIIPISFCWYLLITEMLGGPVCAELSQLSLEFCIYKLGGHLVGLPQFVSGYQPLSLINPFIARISLTGNYGHQGYQHSITQVKHICKYHHMSDLSYISQKKGNICCLISNL